MVMLSRSCPGFPGVCKVGSKAFQSWLWEELTFAQTERALGLVQKGPPRACLGSSCQPESKGFEQSGQCLTLF